MCATRAGRYGDDETRGEDVARAGFRQREGRAGGYTSHTRGADCRHARSRAARDARHRIPLRGARRIRAAPGAAAAARDAAPAGAVVRARHRARPGVGLHRDRCVRQRARVVRAEPASRCAARAQPQHGARERARMVARGTRRTAARDREPRRRSCDGVGSRARALAVSRGTAVRRGERVRVCVAARGVRSRAGCIRGREPHRGGRSCRPRGT